MKHAWIFPVVVLTIVLISGAVSKVQQEKSEEGGTLAEWEQTILTATGKESEASKTIAECKSLMQQKITQCETHDGWSVDNAMEITDNTGKYYSFQDVQRKDCEGATEENPDVHVDTAFLDAQTDGSSSYQVLCSVGCNWWKCEEDLTGTWEGTYTETAASPYCKHKESGTKTFKITQKDNSISGSSVIDGVATVIGGEHCEGYTSSSTGTLSGTVSGNQVSGTIMYSVPVHFTATVDGDTLSGTYSYTDDAYGSRQTGNGEFTLQRALK